MDRFLRKLLGVAVAPLLVVLLLGGCRHGHRRHDDHDYDHHGGGHHGGCCRGQNPESDSEESARPRR